MCLMMKLADKTCSLYLAPVHNMKVKANRLVSPGDRISSTRQRQLSDPHHGANICNTKVQI